MQLNQQHNPHKTERTDDEIDLASLFLVLEHAKWLIILFSLVVTSLVAWYSTTLPLTYRATATMLIEASEIKAVSIEEIYGLDSTRQEYFQTQFEILKSRHLAEQVIDSLQLATDPAFNTPTKPSLIQRIRNKVFHLLGKKGALPEAGTSAEQGHHSVRAALVANFMSRLVISPISKTQLVNISFELGDPKLAAKIVNTLGELYIKAHLQEKLNVTSKASDWMGIRLEELRINLQDAEKKLQSFREANDLVDVEGVVALLSQELNELTSQLSSARQTRTQAQAAMRFLENQDLSDIEKLASMPIIADHQSIQEIKKEQFTAENELAELSKRYGPKHNKMIAAKARFEDIRDNYERRVRRLVEGLEQEYQTALENERELNIELESLKQRFQKTARLETEYRVLERDVQAYQQLYDTFLTRMKETGATGDFQSEHARFTDYAEIPVAPVKPKKSLIVALAFVGSLMLAVMAVLVFEFLSRTIKTPADAEQQLGLRVLGITPKIKNTCTDKLPLDCFFEQPSDVFNEVWRTLRTSYLLAHHGLNSKVVTITSTIPGEGKSTTSINLAYALSQVERVLLIEGDLRRPTFARRFNLDSAGPGFFNILAGTHQMDECIYNDPRSSLDILVAGSLVSNPLELLSQPVLDELMQRLRSRYDRIVIDTPPVHVVSDALIFSKHSDSFLYVIRSDKVRLASAKEALERLRRVNAHVDGVVLNGVSKKAAKAYYGYKYDGYYSYEMPQVPLVTERKIVTDEQNAIHQPIEIKINHAFDGDSSAQSLSSVEEIAEPAKTNKNNASEPTVEELMARYLNLAKNAMQQKNYKQARKYLTQIYALNVELPLSFYYRMAYAMYMAGEKEQAHKTATYYMSKAGASGKYYDEASKLLNNVNA